MSPKRLREDGGEGGGDHEGFPSGAGFPGGGAGTEEAMTAAVQIERGFQQVQRRFDMVFCKLEGIEEHIKVHLQKENSAFGKMECIDQQIQVRIEKQNSSLSKLDSIDKKIQICIQKQNSTFSKLEIMEGQIHIHFQKHNAAFSELESIQEQIQISIQKQNKAFSELESAQEQIQLLIQKQNSALSKLESIKKEVQAVTPREDKTKRSFHIHQNHEQLAQEEKNAEVEGLASGGNGKSTSFRLRFLNGMNTGNIYHEEEIKSESNAAIKIGIFDGDTLINSGHLSNVKVEILALEGNFPYDAQEDWTDKEFNEHRAHGRDGNGHVLSGEGTTAQLVNGECELGSIKFKEGSSKARKGMFIVGARVREDVGVRVQEAVMNAVVVQDRRNKLNEKSYPPKLDDRVYRLEEIARDGKYCKRLEKENIFTVKDFLRILNKDPDKLARILQIKKEHKSWEKMVKHASQCCLDGQHELTSYNCEERDVVLFFNCVHTLVAARFSGHYTLLDNFDHDKQVLVDKLKVGAYGYLDLGLSPDHIMKDNFPVPIDTDTNTDSGAGLSYMSSAIQQNFPDHLAAHQVGDITAAVKGLNHAQIKPSCANANNDPGPSSSSLDHHCIHNYLDEGTTQLADQEPSQNDWRQGPVRRLGSGDWTAKMQEMGYEDDPMTFLDDIVEPGLDHEDFLWPRPAIKKAPASAHSNMRETLQ